MNKLLIAFAFLSTISHASPNPHQCQIRGNVVLNLGEELNASIHELIDAISTIGEVHTHFDDSLGGGKQDYFAFHFSISKQTTDSCTTANPAMRAELQKVLKGLNGATYAGERPLPLKWFPRRLIHVPLATEMAEDVDQIKVVAFMKKLQGNQMPTTHWSIEQTKSGDLAFSAICRYDDKKQTEADCKDWFAAAVKDLQ